MQSYIVAGKGKKFFYFLGGYLPQWIGLGIE